ncbi:hypothetical protein MAR_009985 [Mya arenaria]|uniref:Uncharacterized protein n=1 Tax=Mya arenaria TaxID=6604 RepID=A0ABY7E094_MYAAR|nr:hypothetical protein MAR_009985 [Mya arenaria]
MTGGGYYPVNAYAPVGTGVRGYASGAVYQPAVQPLQSQYWTGQQSSQYAQPQYSAGYTPTNGYYQQYGQQAYSQYGQQYYPQTTGQQSYPQSYGQQYYPQSYGQQNYHPGYWTGASQGYYPRQQVPNYPGHYPAHPVHYPTHRGYYPTHRKPYKKSKDLTKTLLGAVVVGAVAGAVARG